LSSSYYERLQSAVGKYKDHVELALKELRRTFVADIVFIVAIPVILSIVAFIWSGIVGFATTLGLGGVNAGERFH
jgi:hypothetical protein